MSVREAAVSKENGDLWQLWSQNRSKSADTGDASVDDLLKESPEDEVSTPSTESEPSPKSDESRQMSAVTESTISMRRSKPLLSGKLATHLAEQSPRVLRTRNTPFKSNPPQVVLSDVQEQAVVAMALVLAAHLTRFASTRFSEETLTTVRDQILHGFEAKDAVRIEVEAYDLLNWFAGAMNPDWQMRQPESTEIVNGETSAKALLEIIDKAIKEQRDLRLRYYTGSRGEFSERIITPIAVSAEKYLVAFCHLRGEERVFRLSRIVSLSPINATQSDGTAPLSYPNPNDTRLPDLPMDDEKSIPKKTRKSKKSESSSHKQSKNRSLFDLPAQQSSDSSQSMPSLLEYMRTHRPSVTDMEIAPKPTKKSKEDNNKEDNNDDKLLHAETPRIPGL